MTQSILGRGWGRGRPAPTGALALMAACALMPAPAASQAGIALSPHRAIYEMTLATTRGGSACSKNGSFSHTAVRSPSPITVAQ